jgi:hypothetical protein
MPLLRVCCWRWRMAVLGVKRCLVGGALALFNGHHHQSHQKEQENHKNHTQKRRNLNISMNIVKKKAERKEKRPFLKLTVPVMNGEEEESGRIKNAKEEMLAVVDIVEIVVISEILITMMVEENIAEEGEEEATATVTVVVVVVGILMKLMMSMTTVGMAEAVAVLLMSLLMKNGGSLTTMKMKK